MSEAQFLNEQTIERADDFFKTYTDLQDFGKVNLKSKRNCMKKWSWTKGNLQGLILGSPCSMACKMGI